MGQWEDVREERGVEPVSEIPRLRCASLGMTCEGGHPHPNLPPSRGKGERGAGSFGNGMMAERKEGLNPVARFLGGTWNDIWVEGDGSPHPRGHERRGKR